MNFINHLANESYLHFVLQKRYWLETVMGLGLLLFIFLGLFYGFAVDSSAAQGAEQESLDRLIIGFAVWLFATGCYTSATSDISTEVANKTLEQLAIAPKDLSYLIAVKTCVHLFSALLVFSGALLVLCLVTGRNLDINYFVLSSSLIAAAPSLIGMGYVTAGITLVHKKATIVQTLIFVGIIGLVSTQAYPLNAFAFAPFALGASVAKEAVSNVNIAEVMPAVYLVVLNSTLYFALGLYVFRKCDRYARSKGTLSHV